MGENGIVLEHHADIPFVGLQVIDNLVVKADFSAVHAVKTRYHSKQRGLAASGGP